MSSSAPRRQLTSNAALFAYAEVQPQGTSNTGEQDAAHATAELALRQRTEAFEQGRQAGQMQMRSELDAAMAKVRDEIARAIQQFAQERQDYYRRVEGEVVALALAIARKVLHREVQIDPQALCGIVRVTLDKLDSATKVDLYVHRAEVSDWRHYFSLCSGDRSAPDIHEDAALAVGQCRVETSLGSTEIGIESQLKEIETGLLDLLAERPGPRRSSNTNQSRAGETDK